MARKYPPFGRTPSLVTMLSSVGTPVGSTVTPRRRRMMGITPNAVQMLQGYGPDAVGGSFNAAWARGSNVVLQPGVR
jgi:hypothetical protein